MDIVGTAPRLPVPGECLLGTHLATYPGGKAANQAIAAARAGASAALIGRVGNDVNGKQLLGFLSDNSVDISDVRIVEGTSTGTALIFVANTGANMILIFAGANDTISFEDFDSVILRRGDCVLSQFEIPLPSVGALLSRARRVGATTILNPSPVAHCAEDIFDLSDIIVVNEVEMSFYLGREATPEVRDNTWIEMAEGISTRPEQTIIVTLGASGAVAIQSGAIRRYPGHVVSAVDSTGAGDCFVGSLSARLAEGVDLDTAMTYANVAASISVQRSGAGPSMPTDEEVRTVLAGVRS